VGIDGFEALLVALWFHLWPEFRARFAFRLSFGPQDIIEAPSPTIVCTPAPLAARWMGHKIIATVVPSSISPAAAILSGEDDVAPMLQFAREMGISVQDLADLPLLERTFELATAPNPTFDECVTVLRLVERLSPNATAGVAGKEQLIRRLAEHLQHAEIKGVLLLRNLSTTGLPTADVIWAALATWAASNKFALTNDAGLLLLIEDALSSSSAVEPWRKAILGGIIAAATAPSSGFPAAFWRWAGARPATLIGLASQLPRNPGFETLLVDATPAEVSGAIGQTVMAIALPKIWFRLHGAAAGASLAPRDALRIQLSVDVDPTSLDGIRGAVRRVTPAELLTISLEMDDKRVICLAAEHIAREPQLLRGINVMLATAQEIWLRALYLNAESWRGPVEPKRSFAMILESVLDGRGANMELIDALSATPAADLIDFPRRAEMWSRVCDPARSSLLQATANGWLEHAGRGEIEVPDPVLEGAILALTHRLDRVAQALVSEDVGALVRVASALPGLDEQCFLRWLQDWRVQGGPLSLADAAVLGRLVLDRRWQRTVDYLVDLAISGRQDIKGALHICRQMVGLLTQWFLGLSSGSSEEKWIAFEDLVTGLYPGGPDENALWDRSGGCDADLKSFGSGRSRWRSAVSDIRRGRGPRLARLLEEMQRDFPANGYIRRMASDPDLRRA
jgi:hypothetical protein